MDRKPIDFLHGDEPDMPEDDEDSEAWFRQQVELVIAEEDDMPAEFMTDEEVGAHWARQRVELADRVEQSARADGNGL